MNTVSRLLVVELLICGAPISAAASVGLPLLLVGAVVVPAGLAGGFAMLALASGASVALLAYWKLALATLRNEVYRFGQLFVAGLAGAIASAVVLSQAEAWEFWAAVLAPITVSALHLCFVQLRKAAVRGHVA